MPWARDLLPRERAEVGAPERGRDEQRESSGQALQQREHGSGAPSLGGRDAARSGTRRRGNVGAALSGAPREILAILASTKRHHATLSRGAYGGARSICREQPEAESTESSIARIASAAAWTELG